MRTKIQREEKLFNEEIKEWKVVIKTPRYRYLVKKVKEILVKKKYKSVLEIGCGISHYLKDIPANEKTGLDLSGEMLKRNYQKGIKFVRGNALECSKILNKKFDFIFMVGFLHHLDEKEHFIAIKEIKKLLKKGGKLLIVEPNMVSITFIYYNIKKIIERLSKSFLKKIIGFLDTDEKYIYPKKLKRILLKNNLCIEKFYTLQTLRLPPIKLIKRIDIEGINRILDKFIKNYGTVLVVMTKNQ